jgi:general stress protein YciG
VVSERKGFNGHTPRQARATQSKGGKARIRKVTREQLREWGRKGGEANKRRWERIRAEGAGAAGQD